MGRKLLAIDFETTGLSPSTAQAIQVGCFVIDAATLETLDKFQCYFGFDASQFRWSRSAERVHGISQERLADEPSLRENGRVLRDWLQGHFPEAFASFDPPKDHRIRLLGHNVPFDARFLEQVLQAAGDVAYDQRGHPQRLDTVRVARDLWGVGRSSEVFPKVGIIRGAHDAFEDALACVKILRHAPLMARKHMERIGMVEDDWPPVPVAHQSTLLG